MKLLLKQFFAFLYKEFAHIFRDRTTTAILIILPLVQLVMFGYALNTEVKNNATIIYDPSKDEVTLAVIDLIRTNPYFDLYAIVDSPDEIEPYFTSGKANIAIVFGSGFRDKMLLSGDAQVQIIADGTDPNTALTITNYATAIIGGYLRSQAGEGRVPYSIDVQTRLLYNPGLKSAYNFVPGVMGMILLLICSLMTSVSIAKEKETGTMEVLLVSPLNVFLLFVAKAVPYFVISCLNLATILLMAVYMLEVPINGSLVLLLILCMEYIMVSLSLGLLISSVAPNQITALLAAGMGLMVPVMLLSGMMFPVENMPPLLQVISSILPARWYIEAIRKIMIKGTGFAAILKEMLILGGMVAFFTALSIRAFKHRLE